MKKLLTLVSLWVVLFHFHSFATNSLYIINPRGGGSYPGEIKDVELKLTPKGSYMQHDITMTIALGGSLSTSDTLEAVLNFNLEKNDLCNDSWLWIDDYISKAKLIDRSIASAIYEGIVRRRRDPSILTKNGTQYSIRIFPLTATMPRKIKISYLRPMEWNKDHINIVLPTNIFKTSYPTIPKISIAIKDGTYLSNFMLQEYSSLPLMDSNINGYKYYSLLASQYTSLTQLTLKANKSISEISMTKYPLNADEGYFESVLDMKNIIVPAPKKICLVLEYEDSPNELFTGTSEFITFIKSTLLQNYTAQDSFMLVYTDGMSPTGIALVNEWTPIEIFNLNYFLNFALSTSMSDHTFATKELLAKATEIIHQKNRGGEILLVSNLNNKFSSWNPILMNNYTMDVKTVIDSSIAIHTINYFAPYYSTYIDYYSNSRLLKNISSLTHGIYNDAITTNAFTFQDYYYSTVQPSVLFSQSFIDISRVIPIYSFNTNIAGGFIMDKFESNYFTPLKEKSIVRISGRYYGNNPISIDFNMYTDTGIFSKVLTSTNILSDSTVKQVHIGNKYILPYDNSGTSTVSNEINNLSMQHRVLCKSTAFLALEIIDSVEVCLNCSDPESGGGGTVTVIDPVDINLNVYPNPFSESFHISATENIEKLEVFDILGHQLLQLTPAQASQEISINASDCNLISSGIYFIHVYTAQGVAKMKVIKN